MKRILTFLFLFSFLFASSQTQFLGAPNTTIVVKGNMKVDSILYLPKREKTPTDTGALRYQISDSSLYVWTGNAWRKAKNDGTVTSVGLTMPTAFAVANSPVTTSGTLAVTATGSATEYIRGDGTLGTLPTSGGGGGSGVNYYLNGSVSQGTIGGSTYYEMNKVPVVGTGTNFTASADGLIAQFITDAGDPNRLLIPAGAWNFELYFSASSGGGTPTFYVELLKYDGTTFTSIASSSANPIPISNGTVTSLYVASLAVTETVLTATDRLAIRVYTNVSGRTITFHTEDNNLAQVITTFAGGVVSLNGLTANDQFFATGTTGTNFNIASTSATHTFNLPTASATNRGALSSTDWSTFNNKVNISDTATMLTPYIRHAGNGLTKTGQALSVDTAAIATRSRVQKGIDSVASVRVGGTGTTNYVSKWTGTSTQAISQIFDNGTRIGIGTTSPASKLHVVGNFEPGQAAIMSQTFASIAQGGTAGFGNFDSIGTRLSYLAHDSTGMVFFNAAATRPTIFYGGTSGLERMRIAPWGFIGIGITNPLGRIVASGSESGILRGLILRNSNGATNSSATIDFETSGGSHGDEGSMAGRISGIRTGAGTTGAIALSTTNGGTLSEKMRIIGDGNVGIGNISPAYKLDITGTLRNTTGAAFATSSGNVLVGTTVDGGVYKLDVQGALRNTTGANFATSSGNVVVGGTGTGSQKLEVVGGDALIHTIRVGRGGGAIASNLVVGQENALNSNTTGIENTVFGRSALTANTTGSQNVAIGFNSLITNQTGAFNTSVGHSSLLNNTASANTAFGANALRNNTTGTTNLGIGSSTLESNTTGSGNVAIGHTSLLNATTGSNNTAVGLEAGRRIASTAANTITNNSIFIGYNTKASADNQTNQTVIGYDAVGNGSNTTTIGNSSTATTFLLGKLDVGSFDSTGTGINMLYADASGVIKKAAVPSGGGGSVTSITAGTGLTGGTITTSGTIAVDTASIATRARVQKGIDSVTTLANTKVSGTGISGYFPKWTGSTTQDTSQLFQLGRNIGIGTATPAYRLHLPDAGNTANQAMLAGSVFGSDGNGQTITPNSGAMTYYGQGGAGYLYGAQVSSAGRWGINTRSLNDATFNVDGSVKIVTIDSTSTARNMLYQDANGVIKKSIALSMADDVMTASGSWVATKDAGSGVTINNVAYTTNGTTKMVTVDGNFYIPEASWTDATWVTVSTIPSGFRPSKTINWNSNFIVSGAEYERADNTDFTGAQGIQGQMRIRDDGTVQINATMDVPTIAAGGTDYIIVTFTQSYIIK